MREESWEGGPLKTALRCERRQRKQRLDQSHDVTRCPRSPSCPLLPSPALLQPAQGAGIPLAPLKGNQSEGVQGPTEGGCLGMGGGPQQL